MTAEFLVFPMPRLQDPDLLRSVPPLPKPVDRSARAAFIGRLKTYLFGVGIGCILAAMLLFARCQMQSAPSAGPPATAPTAPTGR